MSGMGNDGDSTSAQKKDFLPLSTSMPPESKRLREETMQKTHDDFIQTYRVLPQTLAERDAMIQKQLLSDQIVVKTPITAGEFPSFKFNYVDIVDGAPKPKEGIWTDVFLGLGNFIVVFMPGADTPTCTGTHLPSFFDANNLLSTKQHGVDIILIVTPDTQDSLCSWVRRTAAHAKQSQLVPDSLPANDTSSKITLNPNMPIIIPVADPGLELINKHGMVLSPNRLGITSSRGIAIYDKSSQLQLFIKADDPSLAKCTPVLAKNVVAEVEKLNLLGNKKSVASKI